MHPIPPDSPSHTLIFEQTVAEVRRRLAGQAAGHGFDHIQRVLRNARKIHAEVGGDLHVIELSALLHDVGDAKFHDGQELSGVFAREILTEFAASEETIRHVVSIVDNISFRKRESAEPLSLEGMVVQDADRLDALGAIGIVRTIEYGAAFGQPFYLPEGPMDNTGIGHFYEKLFKLKELMNTDTAKRMAQELEDFMKRFVAQFLAETASHQFHPGGR